MELQEKVKHPTPIIVIEDDEQVRSLIKDVLEKAGHQTTVFSSWKAAQEDFENTSPHLAIVDLLLPEADGLEIVLSLRRDQPSVKIIAISGGLTRLNESLLDLARKFGAHQILKKPFPMETLLNTVETLLPKPGIP